MFAHYFRYDFENILAFYYELGVASKAFVNPNQTQLWTFNRYLLPAALLSNCNSALINISAEYLANLRFPNTQLLLIFCSKQLVLVCDNDSIQVTSQRKAKVDGKLGPGVLHCVIIIGTIIVNYPFVGFSHTEK